MTQELDRLVGFGRFLRARCLPVGTGRILTFSQAVSSLALGPEDLYWAARTSLVSNKDHFEAFDQAFADYFGAEKLPEEIAAQPERPGSEPTEMGTIEVEGVSSGAWELPDDKTEESDEEVAIRITASSTEVLRTKSFEDLTDEERARVALLIRRIAPIIARREVRRLRPDVHGDRFDLRRTLRGSLRTGGEPFRRARKGRRTKLRPLVLILDVSGSMSPYARAFLQFGLAAMEAGRVVEVFCFGTRLTRVTRSLKTGDTEGALTRVAAEVSDWDGGTRIGGSLYELVRLFGQHGFLRGSVVVLCSDGLERGDPAQLEAAMGRLARLAHRIVWVNPLKGSPQYEPLARGMAAALPHVDTFLSGHNVASLEELAESLG
ncbi:MAG: VWA domain-containing protein [Actinobacteria bacterium]|nr:VWA domain-containing protein [Actinomycetota bacterium]